ncbi:MAG: hypothetical protein D6677_05060 [Calditrichaeota bacterium]|nr:MAG: hypothetical protein D6677_05060 [Calditrichota bacterium]
MKTNPGQIPEEWQILLMKALDDALSEAEWERFEQLLKSSTEFRREWEELSRVRQITRKVGFKAPRKEVWDMYQSNIYNRLERGISWFVFIIGVLLIAGYGIFEFITEFLTDAHVPLVMRVGVSLTGAGVLALFASVLREKLFMRKNDPYNEVQR